MRTVALAAACFLPSIFATEVETCSTKAPQLPSTKETVMLQAKVTAHDASSGRDHVAKQGLLTKRKNKAEERQHAKKARVAATHRRVLAKLARRRAKWARSKAMLENPFEQRVGLSQRKTKPTHSTELKSAESLQTLARMHSLKKQAHFEVPERLRSLKADMTKLPLNQQAKANQKFESLERGQADVAHHVDGQNPKLDWIYAELEGLWWAVGELEHAVYHSGHEENGHHYDDHDEGHDGTGVHGELYCETGDRATDYALCMDTAGDGGPGCCHWNEHGSGVDIGRCFSDIGRATCYSAHEGGYDAEDDYDSHDGDEYVIHCEDRPIPENHLGIESCEQAAGMGLCTEMEEEAMHFCPITCGYCAPEPGSAEWQCVDRIPNPVFEQEMPGITCGLAADMGLCVDPEAALWCGPTCGYCSDDGSAPAPHPYGGGDAGGYDGPAPAPHPYSGGDAGGYYGGPDAGGYYGGPAAGGHAGGYEGGYAGGYAGGYHGGYSGGGYAGLLEVHRKKSYFPSFAN